MIWIAIGIIVLCAVGGFCTLIGKNLAENKEASKRTSQYTSPSGSTVYNP